jgi:hypothetical protein
MNVLNPDEFKMEIYPDIMVDIETLGTEPDSAIISIAAVSFDLRTGAIGEKFLVNIDVKSNVEAGRKVNPDTLAWWIDNFGDVFAKWCNEDKVPLSVALIDFAGWLHEQVGDLKSYQIWGNSNRFDLGILADAYNHNNPWHFRGERDVRTLEMFDEYSTKSFIKEEFKNKGEDLHNPLTDCLIQIAYCSKIYNNLKPQS